MQNLFNAIAKLNLLKNKLARKRVALSDEDLWDLKNRTAYIAKKLIDLEKQGAKNDKNN